MTIIRADKDSKDARKKNTLLAIFSILIIIPSFFILRDVLKSVNEQTAVKEALEQSFGQNKTLIDDWEIVRRDSTEDILAIKVYSSSLPKSLSEYSKDISTQLPQFKVAFIPTADVSLKDFEALTNKVKDFEKVDSLVANLTKQSEGLKSEEIIQLENQLSAMNQDTSLMAAVRLEILSTFSANVEEVHYFHPSPASVNPPMLIVDWKGRKSSVVQKQLVEFVKVRAGVGEVVFGDN